MGVPAWLSRHDAVGSGPIASHSLSEPSSTATTVALPKLEPWSVLLLMISVRSCAAAGAAARPRATRLSTTRPRVRDRVTMFLDSARSVKP